MNILALLGIGGDKVATWVMIQAFDNGMYMYNTEPMVLPLPNGSVALLTSYQVRSSGPYDRPCMTIVNSAGATVDSGQALTGASSGDYWGIYNGGSNNQVSFWSSNPGSPTQCRYATYDAATTAYTSATVKYGDDGAQNYYIRNSRPKTGYKTIAVNGGTTAYTYNGTTIEHAPFNYSTGTWRNLNSRAQVDVDGSSNPCFFTAAQTGNNVMFGRMTGSSYTGYSFDAGASQTEYTIGMSMRAAGSALLFTKTSATETRLYDISSPPAMNKRIQLTYASGALSPIFVCHDPDDTNKAYMLFTTGTATQMAVVRIDVSTGTVDWQKLLTFVWPVNSGTFMACVYVGYLYVAGKSTSASANIAPYAFYAKFDKSSITNGTYYTNNGITSSYLDVTIATLSTTITPSVMSNLSLTNNALTRGSVYSLSPNAATTGLVPFFGNGVKTGV